MSDLDPQTRDLRAALRPTKPAARRDTGGVSPLIWVVLLVILGAVVWFVWGRTLVTPIGEPRPAASSAPDVPPGG